MIALTRQNDHSGCDHFAWSVRSYLPGQLTLRMRVVFCALCVCVAMLCLCYPCIVIHTLFQMRVCGQWDAVAVSDNICMAVSDSERATMIDSKWQ